MLLHQSPNLLIIIFLFSISNSANHPIVKAQNWGTSNSRDDNNDTSAGPFAYIGAVILVFSAGGIFLSFIICFLRCFNIYRRSSYLQNGGGPQLPTWRSTTEPSQQRGVDPTLLQTFPVFKYSQAAAALTINIPDENVDQAIEDDNNKTQECAVCLMAFEEKDQLRLLPKCDHVFHKDCIDTWLADHTSCPFCRADLLTQESTADGKRRIKGTGTTSGSEMSSTLTENRGPRDVRVVISTGDGPSRSGLGWKEEELNRPRSSRQ